MTKIVRHKKGLNMKKIITLMITILLLLSITINVNAAYETCYVTASVLNCRTQPNIQSAVITTFNRGKELQVIGAEGSWWQVYDGMMIHSLIFILIVSFANSVGAILCRNLTKN